MHNLKADIEKFKELLPHKEKVQRPGTITRLLHDLGLAVWFGGSLIGILAVNPAVEVLDDPEERGKLVDEAWARFQPYGALGLLTVFVAHICQRRRPPARPTAAYKSAAIVKDLALVGASVASLASLALGEYTVGSEPDTYTPIENAADAGAETAEASSSGQGGLTLAAWGQIISGVLLFVTGAILATERNKSD